MLDLRPRIFDEENPQCSIANDSSGIYKPSSKQDLIEFFKSTNFETVSTSLAKYKTFLN